jgi:putative holliday junction resolvase
MRILALDLGDKWVGSAIADPLGITCKPYQTIDIEQLHDFLEKTLSTEDVTTVVVGNPKTVSSGGESEQTKKIIQLKEELEKKFSHWQEREIAWILWDERLSSKRADQLKGKQAHTPEGKKQQHSIAAAFILQSYLDYRAFHQNN